MFLKALQCFYNYVSRVCYVDCYDSSCSGSGAVQEIGPVLVYEKVSSPYLEAH